MIKLTMESCSLMHGDANRYDLEGTIYPNRIEFKADKDMVINWTDTTLNISNGLNLELNKELDSTINTEDGDVSFQSKMTELFINDKSILFIYEVIIKGEVQEIRKIEYRW